jgi:hypothetical protein
VNGTTWVTLHYLPYDRVTVSATAGGTAGPASQWVAVGRSTNLTALPMAGYRFQGWSGTVVGTLENLSFVVNVPSHEVAAFRPIPAPTWTVTLATPGLPTGLNATFALGADRFSGSAGSAFENLSTGWYSLAAGNVTDPSGGARYVVISTALAPGGAPNGSALLNANATLTVSFRTEYLLTIVAVGGGTTTPVPGAEWVNASAPVDLTAVPDGGRRFLGWTGLGPGHVDSASSAVAVTLTGAVTESASFAVRPPPVLFPYNLTVAETGLPPGTPWSVTGAGAGGAGDGTSIVLPRLNGTYTIVTGPAAIAPGVRYAPSSAGGYPVDVSTNQNLTIAFHLQFDLTVTGSTGGTAGPPGGWENASSAVVLTETPSPGFEFAGWLGNGSGSYSGPTPSPNVTLAGSVLEIAQFEPIPSPSSPGSNGNGARAAWWIGGLGLAIGVIAVAAALVLTRRSRNASEPSPEGSDPDLEPSPGDGGGAGEPTEETTAREGPTPDDWNEN